MPDVQRPHVVVIGAGISGLTAAWRLGSAGMRVTVLDGAPQVGGKLRLGEVAGQQVDLGAEAMLSVRSAAVDLAREVGIEPGVVHPTRAAAAIWTRGALRPLPRTLMGIPADLDAALASGILDEAAVDRARGEASLGPVDLGDDIGIGRLVEARLGPEVRDRLVEPLLGGVYAGRADDISVRAAVPQLVAGVEQHGSLLAAAAAAATTRPNDGGGAAPVFAGLAGGVGRLPVALAERLREHGHEVRASTMARELVRRPGGWSVVTGATNARQVVEADAVVVAVPATAAARLLEPVAPASAAAAGEISYASMALVTMAFDPSRLDDAQRARLSGSGFLVPPVDGRSIKAATFSSSKWDWLSPDHVVIRCSIGRAGEERHLQRADEELVAAARADLREAVALAVEPVDALVTRWGGGLPQYAVGHLDRVAAIRSGLQAAPGIEVCGAAYSGVGIAACVADATDAAARVVGRLTAA